MKNNRKSFRQKQRSYLAAGVIALTAVVAMAGLYYKNTNKPEQERYQTAQTEEREEAGEREDCGKHSEKETQKKTQMRPVRTDRGLIQKSDREATGLPVSPDAA